MRHFGDDLSTGMLDPIAMGTAIQADLAKVGLKVKIETYEWNTFLGEVNPGLDPDRRLDAIEGLPPAVNRLPPGCAFADRCPRVRENCRVGDIPFETIGDGRQARCLYPLVEGELAA